MVICRDCAQHFRGECPEGWPPSERSPERLPTPVKQSSRTAFGIVWFESEADAEKYGEAVHKGGQTYNGGFMDGVACGRDKNWDMDEDGRRLYAVTTR